LLVVIHVVELSEGRQLRRLDVPDGLVEGDDHDVVRVALRLVVEGIAV
jgi:hypothetical protein